MQQRLVTPRKLALLDAPHPPSAPLALTYSDAIKEMKETNITVSQSVSQSFLRGWEMENYLSLLSRVKRMRRRRTSRTKNERFPSRMSQNAGKWAVCPLSAAAAADTTDKKLLGRKTIVRFREKFLFVILRIDGWMDGRGEMERAARRERGGRCLPHS